MDESLNIVDLIENNPLTRLTETYQHKLLCKIKSKFTDEDQQMFVASFYCFLNFNTQTDFAIDLDNVWKWIGFSQKVKAKELLERYFLLNIDYKLLSQPGKQSIHIKGGHNKEIFMLTIKTFKRFCLKAGTTKAEQIHDYYINLEEILQEVLLEESCELKQQLDFKHNEFLHVLNDKEKIREKTLIEQFPSNTQCVYYGTIDNMSDHNEKLIKFGNSNNLRARVVAHKNTYLNFKLVNAFKVENKIEIENAIKTHIILSQLQRIITLKHKKYVELLSVHNLSFYELDKIIKEIINGTEFNSDNFLKLLSENCLLRKQLDHNNETNHTHQLILMTAEINQLKSDNIKIIKNYNALKRYSKTVCDLDENVAEPTPLEILNYGVPSNSGKKIKQNGNYIFDGKIYDKLVGTRQDVWDELSYKTSGGLLKNDLVLNKLNKIVSKKKYIQETINKRFEKCGVNQPTDI